MQKLMLSTAILVAFGLPAAAQVGLFVGEGSPGSIHASDLIGKRVYASEAAVDADEYSGVQEGWADIGEINDLVVTREGMVESVLVDIGGFLGLGERQTAVDMTSLRFVSDSATPDDADDWFLVMNADRATIEGAPEWKTSMTDATVAPTDGVAATETEVAGTAAADTTTGMATETADVPAADGMAATDAPVADGMAATDGTAVAPVEGADGTAIARDGYAPLAAGDLTTEMLTGATAYDANDQSVGELSDLILAEDGKITGAIIDVGGFLGMGAKPVEVKLEQLEILRQTEGSDVRVYLSASKEELEAMPEYAN